MAKFEAFKKEQAEAKPKKTKLKKENINQ